MRRKSLVTWLLCALGMAVAIATSQAIVPAVVKAQGPARAEVTIITGSEAGNYYEIARDLEVLVDLTTTDLDLDVIPSTGSLDNIVAIDRYNSIVLGLSQRDVTAYLTLIRNEDPVIDENIDALRLVLPLYDEQVHLLAREGINSFADLTGKLVAVGESGSGTFITSTLLLLQANVTPAELIVLENRRAIDALLDGEIDAMFFVVGAPARLLQEEIDSTQGIKLVPIALEAIANDEFLSDLYEPRTLPRTTYSWQSEPVDTIAVQSAIYTTEGANCSHITPIVESILENLDQLRANGNTVWRRVAFDRIGLLEEPRLSACTRQALQSLP
ncbi:TRAP transporter solute receptor, TAXI family [Rubidibacter lacunae KORDI 51-2]|uniref:TRAP transporter solute receptor, TAXI family n=1 Tax=Rubidibacter lacunae KORDI 51-2 TaxID=582515 RepID=U5DJH5_9CHRO|nr:TAXI family TRAP transporter solute-binding subunit [Rubidibacter lacunae]ERN41072.1 TRAP transporter solute receptor, TAXI family [Rubidibacter lacunae KORDI 51-2]